MKLDHFLTPYTNRLQMDERPKRETRIQQNPRGEHRSNLFDLDYSNFLQDTSPKARETKAKMNYWDFIKIKSFCTAREQSTKVKGNLWNGRRYLQMTSQIKG